MTREFELQRIDELKHSGLLTDSEYNKLYYRITGQRRLTKEQAERFVVEYESVRASINNLLSLGLITEQKSQLLDSKATKKLMDLIASGKIDETTDKEKEE